MKVYLFFLVVLQILSLFFISHSFVNHLTPTLYSSAIICFILMIAVLIKNYKKKSLSLTLSEIIFIFFVLIGTIHDVNFEWIILGVSLLCFYFVTRRINIENRYIFLSILVVCSAHSILGLIQYLIYLHENCGNFYMCGSLDNPAGFAATMLIGFSCSLYFIKNKQNSNRILGYLTLFLFIISAILAQSRASIFAITIVVILFLKLKFSMSYGWRYSFQVTTIVLFVIFTLISLYYTKKDSADGRMFIWQRTIKMIADKPLFGHGIGGFQKSYMLYQADYFKKHKNDNNVILADVVKHPFNEYLKLVVEFGIAGSFIILFFFYLLIKKYPKNIFKEETYILLLLIGIAIFATFSYPLYYSYIRVIFILFCALMMRGESNIFKIPRFISILLKPLTMAICLGLMIISIKMFYYEYYWDTIARRSLEGETKNVYEDYKYLCRKMGKNGYFLYNYGAELNNIDSFKISTDYLLQSSKYFNDIDLQLLLADNYQKMREYREAESCLKLASNMVPNRFIPLYRLVQLYKETGENEKAKNIARIIVNKPVKISSPEILYIKSEMEKELINHEDSCSKIKLPITKSIHYQNCLSKEQ